MAKTNVAASDVLDRSTSTRDLGDRCGAAWRDSWRAASGRFASEHGPPLTPNTSGTRTFYRNDRFGVSILQMVAAQTVCLFCRLRLLARLSKGTHRQAPQLRQPKQLRTLHTSRLLPQPTPSLPARGEQTEKIWTRRSLEGVSLGDDPVQERVASGMEGLAGRDIFERPLPNAFLEAKPRAAHSSTGEQLSPEAVARAAREAFGDHLPEGALSEEQYKIYERLYGPPPKKYDEIEEDKRVVLYKERQDGLLEEIGVLEPNQDLLKDSSPADGLDETAPDTPIRTNGRSRADEQLQRDIATAVTAGNDMDFDLTIRSPDAVIPLEAEEPEEDDEFDTIAASAEQNLRAHPFTGLARFGTSPAALPLPRSSFVKPVALLLSNINNKHLDDSARRILGGLALPSSPSTPPVSRTKPQTPIPLNAAQGRMSEIEADVYMAAIMPPTYASVMSALVEVRKRLGARWLEDLLNKEEGPRILDAGAGGAGVLAWREVLKAEWRRMHDVPESDPSVTRSTSDQEAAREVPQAPLGRATVLTGSNALRARSSVLLDDTTFIPRLPDYVHASNQDDTQRKRFDIIVAPHSLWHLQDSYDRRQKVLNLWSLLNPDGGVLVLLEKGVPRGFEVVADARGYLIGQLFERESDDATPRTEEEINPVSLPPDGKTAIDDALVEGTAGDITYTPRAPTNPRRAPAHIIAPCPHEFACPLYLIPGVSTARKDYCHFRQRYIRPPYLQRMLNAKDRNFEDVEFSYIAVRKGRELDPKGQGRLRGSEADARAFDGYEIDDEDVAPPTQTQRESSNAASATVPPISSLPTTLPRLLLPPLKRTGHIHLDVCTPGGTFSRWTVPRSYGRQAYRDARKARWGDLWALGAKQQESRRVRLGRAHMAAGLGVGRGVEAAREEGKPRKSVRDVKGVSRRTTREDVLREREGGKKSWEVKKGLKRERVSNGSDEDVAPLVDSEERGEMDREEFDIYRTSNDLQPARRKEDKARGREKARRRKRVAREAFSRAIGS